MKFETRLRSDRILPAHVEDTVEAIVQLHTEHARESSSVQRFVERLTHVAAKPSFVASFTVGLLAWIAINLILPRIGLRAFDAPPFAWLETAVTILAMYLALLILITQRRDDELAARRDQLTLELAILGEQKSAKIIQLIEELRRDHPMLNDRFDAEASAMSIPTDPHAVLDAITERNSAQLADIAAQENSSHTSIAKASVDTADQAVKQSSADLNRA